MQRLDPTTSAEEYVSSFLSSRLEGKEKRAVEQMKVQMIWLEPPGRGPTATNTSGQLRKRLSSRQKKELGLYEIPKEKQRYCVCVCVSTLYFSLQ